MFIWADNLADSLVLILANLKLHSRRLSAEGSFIFATRVGRRDIEGGLDSTTRKAQEATLYKCQLFHYWAMTKFP
jgi:hypothetical protein